MQKSQIFPTLKRDIRYTKFDFHFADQSRGRVFESTYKQTYGKHTIYLNMTVDKEIADFNVSYTN